MTYREGENTVSFSWEFGMAPEIVLIWGPSRAAWDAEHPWAIGRQAAIYDFVGAEVVRQKVPNGAFESDLDQGFLTILDERGARARGLYVDRAAAAAEERRLYASLDARLAAAEATNDSAAIEAALAREIRRLYQPSDGLDRAMRLAAAHPTEGIRQALLWASYNATECARRCAETLMAMTNTLPTPLTSDVQSMLARLGRHTSDMDRKVAFEELSARVGMTLDYSLQD